MIVSVIHVIRASRSGVCLLNDRPVERISAFLFHDGGDEDPSPLKENARRSFKGCEIGSLGFLITPDTPDFVWLSAVADPRRADLKILKPYIGGEDLNTSPVTTPPRFIIDSDGLDAAQMAKIPRVQAFLKARVRADRLQRRVISEANTEWWHFRRPSLEYRRASAQTNRVLAVSEVTSHCNFAFVPTTFVPAHTLKLFSWHDFGAFAILQSRIHEVWARFFGSSMKDDLRYTPTDCFETFPFAPIWCTRDMLDELGKDYYDFRAKPDGPE